MDLHKRPWDKFVSAAMAVGGAAKFETTDRYYYNYVSNCELKATGMKADTYPWSTGDQLVSMEVGTNIVKLQMAKVIY